MRLWDSDSLTDATRVLTVRGVMSCTLLALMTLCAAAYPVAALAVAGQPLSAIQKQLQNANSELAMNKSVQDQPTISSDARQALKDRADVLVQTIAQLKDQENALLVAPKLPASAAAPSKGKP